MRSAVSAATPVTVTASMTAPPTMTLAAPASEAMENVRIPAGERAGPPPLRRSRSAPIRSPMPSATTRFSSTEGRSGMFFRFAKSCCALGRTLAPYLNQRQENSNEVRAQALPADHCQSRVLVLLRTTGAG